MNRKAYSYSCLMANVPKSLADKVRDFGASIPDERILQDEKGERGRQEEVHITVKYGIHTDDPAAMLNILENVKPLRATLGKTTIFWNNESIVLKVAVQSQDLVALNSKVRRELECTDTYPDYKPHITIAYVKKDEKDPYWFQKYLKSDFDGVEVVLDELIFSTPDGQKYKIMLKESDMKDKISKIAKDDYPAELAKAIEESHQQIHGWKASWEYPGFLDWTHPGMKASVQATPFWDDDGHITVQVTTDDGDFLGGFEIPMQKTGDIAKDVDTYFRLMNMAWHKVQHAVGLKVAGDACNAYPESRSDDVEHNDKYVVRSPCMCGSRCVARELNLIALDVQDIDLRIASALMYESKRFMAMKC